MKQLYIILASLTLVACFPQADQDQSGPESATKSFRWSMVTTWPKNYPGLGSAVERFAERVKQMSNGRLVLKVYGAGERVPALEVFDAVQSGAAQMGHGAAYYWRGKMPAAVFFTAIPFGMTAEERNGWLYQGGGLELWRELYQKRGVIPFPGGNTGTQWGGWFKQPINDVKDLQGLIVRMPGLGGETLARIGAQQSLIPGGELFQSLDTGVVDAAEWVGPYNDRAFGFQDIADYYYYPGWQEAGPTLEFIVNQQAWETLPQDLQSIVEVAAMSINLDMLAEYTARNPLALEQIEQSGVKVQPFPPSVIAAAREASQGIVDELVTSDAEAAKIHASWKSFLESARAYRSRADHYFIQIREHQP